MLAATSHTSTLATSARRDAHREPGPNVSGTDEHIAIAVAPADRRARLQSLLAQYPWHPGIDQTEQGALEARYLDWAAEVLRRREEAFGTADRYAPECDMRPPSGEALVRAAFDAGRKFLSSASRSPVSNMVTVTLAPRPGTDKFAGSGEFSNSYDPAVVGGLVGGASAYFADKTILSAMDWAAKRANLAQLTDVNVKALVPDPCPVRLVVTKLEDACCKHYEDLEVLQPDEATDPHATLALLNLQSECDIRRAKLQSWQAHLQGGGGATLLAPCFTGVTNLGRRAAMDEASILNGPSVLGASALASGVAGALSAGVLSAAKGVSALGQTRIDNLVGGTQVVNLFKVSAFDPDRPAASISDLLSVPRMLTATVRRAAASLGHMTNVLGRPLSEVAFNAADLTRHMFANAFATTFATGLGVFVSQLLRNGRISPDPGESLHSPAALLQQAVQSAASDWTWEAAKRFSRSGIEYDVGRSLDRWRNRRAVEMQCAAQNATGVLQEILRDLPEGLSAPLDECLALQRAAIEANGRLTDADVRAMYDALVYASRADQALLAGTRLRMLSSLEEVRTAQSTRARLLE